MTFGDGLLLFMLGGCALYVRHLWQQDVALGRAQTRPVPYPGWFHAVFALVFGAITIGMLWFGVQELLTPGITELESGRFRGLEVHHRTMGFLMVCVGGVVGWLTWIVGGGFVTERLGSQPTVVVVEGDQLWGAAVGDSGAWLVRDDSWTDVTEHQQRKPLLGTGEAVVVPFVATLDGTLLVATDGLLSYAPASQLVGLVRSPEAEPAATRLVNAVRLPTGALQDDVALALVRA